MKSSLNLVDIDINQEYIGNILKVHWPNFQLINFKPCSRAYMNKVFEVKLNNPNKEYILKISNQPKKFGLEKEVKIINIIKKNSNLPIPEIIHSDFSKKKFPFKYLILEKINGSLLEDIWEKLSNKDREIIAYKCGELLGKLHTIKFESFGDPMTNKRHNSIYSQLVMANKEIRGILNKENLMEKELLNQVKVIINNSEKLLINCNEPTLTHNDFFFWHIFVDKIKKGWEINGIIDFGFASIASKEVDFVKPDRWIFNRGTNIKSKFMTGYKTIQTLDKNHDKLINLYRIHYDLWFYYRLMKTNQIKLADYYKQGILRRVNQWTV